MGCNIAIMKRFLSLLILTGLVYGQSTYSGGNGHENYPYQIATTDDLIELSNTSTDWDKYFIQTVNIAFDSDETQVDWDGDGSVENDTSGFSPIGNISIQFTGEYDGDSYTIDYLFINRSATDYVGFFGYINGATIQNIGVINVDVSGKMSVGGLVGRNFSSTTVSNSYSTGNISGSSDYVGGLVGRNSSVSTISNSYSMCSVNSSGTVGGLAGHNSWASTVINCYSTGSVSGNSTVSGLVGDNDNTSDVYNSFWDTETSGQSSSDGGTGKTTAEMQDFATFNDAGWDFVSETINGTDDHWDMDQLGTVNDGYPILSWQDGADQELPIKEMADLPKKFLLNQNYPNPFNPITRLRYDLPDQTHVNITIYDMLGREVKTLINQTQDAGYKSVIWDATNNYGKPVSAGIYLYQIQAGEYMQTKKMVLLK